MYRTKLDLGEIGKGPSPQFAMTEVAVGQSAVIRL